MLSAAQYVRCACEAKNPPPPMPRRGPGICTLPITVAVYVPHLSLPERRSSVTCWCQSCGRVWCRRRWNVAIWKLLTVGADRFNIPAAAAFFDGCSDSARYSKVSEKSPRRSGFKSLTPPTMSKSSSSFYIYRVSQPRLNAASFQSRPLHHRGGF